MDERALQELLERDAIRSLIASFSRAADRHDWDGLVSLYHEDGTDDHGGFSGPVQDLVVWMAGMTTRATTMHHCLGQSIIDLQGDVAFCETYFISNVTFAADGSTDDGEQASPVNATSVGRYVDRVERRADGVWRFAKRVVVYDFRRAGSFDDITDESAKRSSPDQDDLVFRMQSL